MLENLREQEEQQNKIDGDKLEKLKHFIKQRKTDVSTFMSYFKIFWVDQEVQNKENNSLF